MSDADAIAWSTVSGVVEGIWSTDTVDINTIKVPPCQIGEFMTIFSASGTTTYSSVEADDLC